MHRHLYPQELTFIKTMLNNSSLGARFDAIASSCFVEEMNDGKMGSLLFISQKNNRKLGEIIAESKFYDKDGVEVFASLSLDNFGDFYELDIWKVDFTALEGFPETGGA